MSDKVAGIGSAKIPPPPVLPSKVELTGHGTLRPLVKVGADYPTATLDEVLATINTELAPAIKDLTDDEKFFVVASLVFAIFGIRLGADPDGAVQQRPANAERDLPPALDNAIDVVPTLLDRYPKLHKVDLPGLIRGRKQLGLLRRFATQVLAPFERSLLVTTTALENGIYAQVREIHNAIGPEEHDARLRLRDVVRLFTTPVDRMQQSKRTNSQVTEKAHDEVLTAVEEVIKSQAHPKDTPPQPPDPDQVTDAVRNRIRGRGGNKPSPKK